MKRILLMLVSLFFAVQLFAECNPTVVEQYTTDFISKMEQKVELTADQKSALTTALKSSISDREDILMSYQGQKGMKVKREIQTQLKALNANLQAEAQEILTPEQFSIFQEIQGQNQEKIRARVKNDY